jgi:hypothetical protein
MRELDEGALSTYETVLSDVAERYARTVADLLPHEIAECVKFIERTLPDTFQRKLREHQGQLRRF